MGRWESRVKPTAIPAAGDAGVCCGQRKAHEGALVALCGVRALSTRMRMSVCAGRGGALLVFNKPKR
eukprot:scaffold141230_cov33-Tisochrysis_lutea.AAC.1